TRAAAPRSVAWVALSAVSVRDSWVVLTPLCLDRRSPHPHPVSSLAIVQPPLAHHPAQLALQQRFHQAAQHRPAGRSLSLPRDDMDHGTGLAAPPALEELAHGGLPFD